MRSIPNRSRTAAMTYASAGPTTSCATRLWRIMRHHSARGGTCGRESNSVYARIGCTLAVGRVVAALRTVHHDHFCDRQKTRTRIRCPQRHHNHHRHLLSPYLCDGTRYLKPCAPPVRVQHSVHTVDAEEHDQAHSQRGGHQQGHGRPRCPPPQQPLPHCRLLQQVVRRHNGHQGCHALQGVLRGHPGKASRVEQLHVRE